MEISEAFATAYREETGPQDRSGCPTSEQLTAFVAGELSPAERDKIADHLVGCSACALEVRLAKEAHEFFLESAPELAAAPGADQPADGTSAAAPVDLAARREQQSRPNQPRPARRSARRPAAILAVAASLVLALGLAWQLGTVTPGPDGDVVRSVPVAGELAPAENATLDTAPTQLTWPAEAGAQSYRVELLDSAARTIWTGDWGSSPSAELPSEIVSSLTAGGYLWRVEVRGAVARSELGPYVFTIR